MTTDEQIAHFEHMAETHLRSAINASRINDHRTESGRLVASVIREISGDLTDCLINANRVRLGLEPL